MPNTNVFTGSDATLTLAIDSTPEGQAAKETIDFYRLSPVGRATNVEVYVQTDLELRTPAMAAAEYDPGRFTIFPLAASIARMPGATKITLSLLRL